MANPTLTAFASTVAGGKEDKPITVSFAKLLAQGNEKDVDGTVIAFVVKAVSSGALKIGTSALTATAWAAGSNDIVDAAHLAYWTPAANANGALNAFTAVAKDNGGLLSATAIQAKVAVTAVNDAPTLTSFTSTVASGKEDKPITVSFANLLAQGNEKDVDGTVTAFVVKAVSSGALKIGTSALTATAWAAGSNDIVDAAHLAYWTPAANANGALNAFTAVAKDNGGLLSATAIQAKVAVTAVNDAPTLTSFTSTVASGKEDKPITVSFANLLAQGNEKDVDGTVTAFVVKAVSSGALKIGTSALTATAWAAGSNDIVDAAHLAYWTPAANANGALNAFTAVAKDNGGLLSATAIQAKVAVTAVNDAPTLTSFTSTVASGKEDKPITVSFANLLAQGNEKDVDGTVTAFVVKAVSTGTLKIGTSALTATAWAAGSNDIVDAAHLAYWTPAANANGTLNAFTAVAKDNGGLLSATAIQAKVAVTAVNDAPTLTSFTSTVASGNEDSEITVSFADIQNQGDEAEVDGTVTAFVVKAVSSGTLKIGASAETATAWAAGSNEVIDAVHLAFWTPAANANGTLNAFTAVAQDNDGEESATAIQVKVTVTEVNDAPTLTTFLPPVATGNEDSPITVTFANLHAQGNDADVDGTVTAFVVKAVSSGTLKIGVSAETAKAWAAGSNEVIDAAHLAFWTPAANANGSLNAFTAVAQDNDGEESATAIQVKVTVTEVNDAPTLTTFLPPVATGNEDSPITVTFANLHAQGNDADVDGTVTAFVVKAVSSGTLKIGASAETATAWAAGSNEVIDAAHLAFWTPAANANGTLNAFTAVAQDNDGEESVTAIQVKVTVTEVNDAPTLTTFLPPVATGNEDSPITVTFANLHAQGNDADVDGTVTAFVVKAVSSGTLKIGASAETATAWAAGSNEVIDAAHLAFWTPAANANGTLNAFTAVAQDNDGEESVTAIQVKVTVTEVNDAPTLTTFLPPVATGNEDSPITVTFANLHAQGNDADVDGTVTAFVVKAVSSGTLKIGASAETATAWAAGSNEVIDAAHLAFWTPAANANGSLNAFTAVAQDNDGEESVTAIQAKVTITPVNDAPVATNLNQIIAYTEDTTAAIANIVITDPDADNFTTTVTLADGNSAIGSLSTTSGKGEIYSAATGVWTVTGTLTNVNAALAAISFVPAANGFSNTSASVSISDGNAPAITGTLTFNGTAVNDVPTLTAFTSDVTSGDEDRQIEVNFTDLQNQGDAADVDGTVTAFVIKAVSSGSLKIGDSAETATVWAAGTNDVVDAAQIAFWTPAANANGTLPAFTVVAKDNSGTVSTTPIQAMVDVTAVNDRPTLTSFSSSVASGNEDSPITVTFANLQSKGNEADIDGTVTAFVIQAVSTGTLKIGTSAATATAWAFGSNDVVNATRQAYWTPEMNANGNLNAFTVQARDDGGAKSTPAIQATVAVTAATSLIDIVQTDGNTSVTEGGATDTYTLALKSAPAANVTINLNTTNHQVTSSVNTLNFTTANWAIPQTVTVTAVNDTVGEGLHRGVIQHTAISTDSRYNGIAIEVIVAITDNDLRLTDPIFINPVTNAFGLTNVGYNASPTFADIDGDGDLDAFVGKYDGNTLFYRNTGTASSPVFTASSTNPFGLISVGASASPTFVDIDGDGDLDAFVGKYDGNILFYRNIGTASSPAFAVPCSNPFGLTNVGSWAGPTFADIDGDGDLDVFVGNNAGNTLFYRNTGAAGSPAFAVPITNPFGLTDVGDSSNPTFVDIDGDGDLDAFIGSGSGDTRFYRNTGTASLPTFTSSSNNPFGLTNVGASANPSFADIDSDGDLDVFVGNGSGDTLFYRNGTTPTLTAFTAAVASGNEDSEITVSFANLKSQGNEADVDGTVTAFVIKTVSTGTLKIGSSAGTATAWVAGSNDIVDATLQAYWTPAANVNGNLNAFTALAQDNDGLVSATPIQAKIVVTPVNDSPTLTAFSSAVASGNEDSEIAVSFANLINQGNEADVDGTVTAFVVKAVSTGTLKIGSSVGTATAWAAGSNDIVDATLQAYWTPAANANGTLNAFTAVAKDNGGLVSTTAIQATVAVTAVNDAPTLTSFASTVASGNEDSEIAVSFASLINQGNEADVDGTVTAFVVKAVSTGTLKIGSSAGTATAWAAGSNDIVDATLQAYWTPAANANGSLNAFTTVAKDNGGLVSTAAIQATVAVTAVNDAPTLTSFASTVASGNEDSEIAVSFASLINQGNEADVDGTVTAFVVKAVSTGTLKIGSSAGTATTWAAGSNDIVDATLQAYWTPAANANGALNAFTTVAKDNGGLVSTTAIQATVAVTAVNDAPTLTSFASTVASGNEDSEIAVNFANLQAQGDAADVDGTITAFVVKAVSTGTLKIGSSAGTATAWAAGSNDIVDATLQAYWTPAANANGALNAFTAVAKDNGGLVSTAAIQATVAVTAVNDAPTLTSFASTVASGNEDSEIAVSFASLINQGNEADVDGTVTAFVVKAVSTGTLKIGSSAGTATTWAAGSNDIVDATLQAYWTPAANANGALNAFTTVAKDNGGLVSTTAIQATVAVTAVNDAPTLTSFASTVASGNEDSEIAVNFANLQAQGDEADVDGTVTAFVVKAVSTGTLKIGSSAGTATAWAAGSNDIVDATLQAYWTPAANANGALNAFTAVAKDNGGLVSTAAIQATVAVTAVNDAPTLTSFASTVASGNEDSEIAVSFASLINQGNEADVDGTVTAFVVKAVSTGTLKIGSSAGTATAWAAGSNDIVDATLQAYWTPAANANGSLNAFTTVAKDNGGLVSTAAIQATVAVTAVNDAPTLTSFASTVASGNEDSEIAVNFVNLQAQGDEADLDGTITAFVVKAVSTGTLKIGDSAETATIWATGANELVDATHQAYWTPAANANGTLNAFTAVAKDNGGLLSATAIQATVAVTPVNDAPTFTSFASTVASGNEDSEIAVSFANLQAQGDAGDVDGTVTAFVIESVSTGALKIGASAATATDWAAGSNDIVDATDLAYWTPAANANGTLNAFTVVAQDNGGLVSATAIQATVAVTANDTPIQPATITYIIDTVSDETFITITDFSVVNDTIQLENSVFTQLTATGVLNADNFKIGTAAEDENDYVIYNSSTGALYYDADGSGTGAATQIALLGVSLALTNADFVVI